MPWRIERRSGEYCVIRETDGHEEGCHATRQDAQAQQRALYASESAEDKRTTEVSMDKATWTTAYVNDLPDSAFLHVEEGDKDGEGKTTPRSKRHLPYKTAEGNVDLPHLRNAISRLSQSGTGSGWLSASLRERLLARARRILANEQKSRFDRAVDWLKEAFGFRPEPQDRFMVWKDGDDWRWLAVFSNKFRDEDNPPEILAEQAHRDFVQAVDAGEWPYPELWLWHVPGTKSGQADFLAYDDLGFTIASGTGEPAVMETLAGMDDLGVSHGMPTEEIKRDDEDKTVITRYRSKEISPLPRAAAANRLTFFDGGMDMAIPEEKRKFLASTLGEERTAQLEEQIADKAKEADGLEFKDDADAEVVDEEPAEEVEEAEEPVDDEPKEADSEEAVEEQPDYATREEVAEILAGMGDKLDALAEAIEGVGVELKSVVQEVAELKAEDEEKIAKAAEETPAASLASLISRYRAVGNEAARVDGRTSLAKAGPEEKEADGPTPSTFINKLMTVG